MSDPQVAAPAPTVAVQRAGDGHVVVTLYASEDRVADLAWRLSQLAQSRSASPSALPPDERDFLKTLIDGLAKGSTLVRRTLEDGPVLSSGPQDAPRSAAPLRDRDFELWLERHYRTSGGRPLDRRSIGSQVSNCRRVAEYEGSLDEHFDRDEMAGLLRKFEYGRKDQKQGGVRVTPSRSMATSPAGPRRSRAPSCCTRNSAGRGRRAPPRRLRSGEVFVATIFQFQCPACAHEVESSGEPTALMRACTTPVLCLTCKEVYSAVTHSEELGNFPPGRGRAAPVKCPVNARHRAVRWAPKYGCPKCAAAMVRSEHPIRFAD